jgi:hypothetical protein
LKITQTIAALVTCAKGTDKCECKDISIGKVFNAMALSIAATTGVRLFGVEKIISDYAVRHTIKRHGNDKEERERGQRGITSKDFELIPDILLNPDEVVKGSIERGRQSILFIKAIGDTYYAAFVLDDKRKELVFRTMYKKA